MKNFFFIIVLFSSCTIPQKYQKNKPFVFKNNVEIKGGEFTADERVALRQRMYTLLDDSVKVPVKSVLFLLTLVKRPPAYDSAYAAKSARNMKAALIHLGYYSAGTDYRADTIKVGKEQRVHIDYTIRTGPVTRIDTVDWRMGIPEMQQLAIANSDKSFLKKPNAITKNDVLSEVSRLTQLYRNNGFYKIALDNIKVLGDTTIESLTNISDDPFENLRKLAEASLKRNKPTIRLAVVDNPLEDSSRLKQYYIDSIFIYPDYPVNGSLAVPSSIDTTRSGNVITWFGKKKLVKRSFLNSNIFIKSGELYSQDAYHKTINRLSQQGVWQNVNSEIREKPDTNLLNMLIQLVPAKKFGFETNIEASYSANSNTNTVSAATAGNLLGFSGNISLQNRNWKRQGIKMTHAIRAGIELNLNKERRANQRINSSEVSYTNTIAFPKLIFPFRQWNRKSLNTRQSFINTNVTATNRIALFKLFSLGINTGNEFSFRPSENFIVRTLNIEYSNLYDRTDAFNQTLEANPFLRYSYNTALVIGHSVGYLRSFVNSKHPNRISKLGLNLEESGYLAFIPLDNFGIFKNDLRKFVKFDAQFIRTITLQKSEIAFRSFLGVGTPIGKKDTTLPFFKQYFAGGANSMRGWPIRGIGPGSRQPAPFGSRFLSDRTGDVYFEMNAEYRYHIMQLIPNTLILKGAFFVDAGNVWNMRNTNPNGGFDSSQFSIRNLYKQLGVNLGTGFRLDFNYVVLRVDFGFRFKRPEIAENAGWKAPSIGFNDLLKKIFTRGKDDEYRIWRYENFNFTIGLNYPF
ncbi:MAG TPA: BamA/TamA family outer membrane protein [Ferruginibacter sp.]|nr:BamA/TamA family outer membrane protein [Ferruginibacter sp.]HMP20259.1 BamA/TamA family outer membrane protein [Ferruginibacter sp.]